MHLAPQAASDLESHPELDALHRLDGKERLAQARRQAIVRRRVTTEPGNKARCHDAERAANRVALCLSTLDFCNHRASRLRIRTADLARLDVERRVVHAVDEGAFLAKLGFADAIHIREHLDAQISKEFARDTGRRHASGGRAGARALENVAAIVGVRLQGTHQIGMPRPRRHFAHQPLRLLTEYGHAVRPVLPIAIADRERHRRADGLPETDARRNLHGVTLDGLPAAAPVARLAASQVGVDLGFGDPQARRHVLDDGGKAWAVAFPGKDVTHRGSLSYRVRIVSGTL